ncbi:serine-rich adhesin for platelets isoform X2 [Topomyia yanbarensis]|uniref:serine-rich adhesin for platelets isoform X2 n=1 Tax=Topomyia yanbarensis TaxID=2498891 RepID=UPI00273C6698|nr:serine-rich adhesin for platelets isoform X2 [Topomyia yanbarensis]
MSLELVLVAAAVVAVFGYILFVRIRMRAQSDASSRNDKKDDGKQNKHDHGAVDNESSSAAASGIATNKTGRKAAASAVATTVKKQRTAEANYQHPWLYTTLKGHTRQVLDMDFSRNGKFLATCAEDSPSAGPSSSNHSINGNINENDEQNATTRSLSPASSSSSSSSAFSSVSDAKETNDVSSCSGGGSGATSGSTSSSSSGSTNGEDSPNTQGNSKKQRKYTKKKQQYKKNTNNIHCNNGNVQKPTSNLRQPPSITCNDVVNALQDDHITHPTYYYNSSTSSSTSSLTSQTTKTNLSARGSMSNSQREAAISSANSLWPSLPTPASLASATSPLSSSVKNDKNSSYQGRLDFRGNIGGRGVGTATAQHTDKKYHKGNPPGNLKTSAPGGPAIIATNTTPLRQYVKLNLNENELVKYLRKYVLDKDVMKQLGFPVEYGLDSNKAIIYKFPHDFFRPAQFYPTSVAVATDANKRLVTAGSDKSDDNDSGQGSGTSSPTNVDDNDTLLMYRLSSKPTSLDSPLGANMQLQPSEERECCRCGKGFFTTRDGEYLTQEHCIYHWGRLTRVFSGAEFKKIYSCCNGDADVKGCTINKLHVWTGLLSGFNGPFDGFLRTQPSPRKLKKFEKMLLNKFYYQNMNAECVDLLHDDLLDNDESDGVFALDCEMSYTGRGLDLTKVTVVTVDGSLVYEKFVKPDIEIVDYNTRYSGVTEADFANPRNYVTLKQVQKDLLSFIYDDTILIGHAIENDLKVLKIIHKTVIDTSITFPHMNGFPFRQSLKSLTKNILKRDIQMLGTGGTMHSRPQHHINDEFVCSSSSSIRNSSNSRTSNASCDNSKCNSNTNSSSGSSNSFGHCSLEDSRASLELMLWRVRKDKAVYDNIWNGNNCYRLQNN